MLESSSQKRAGSPISDYAGKESVSSKGKQKAETSGYSVFRSISRNRTVRTNISDNLYCPICRDLVTLQERKAKQCTNCEKIFCPTDLDRDSVKRKCPSCRIIKPEDELYTNVLLKTAINNLVWECTKEGCNKKGNLDVLEKHTCDLGKKLCPHEKCGISLSQDDIDEHIQSCPWRPQDFLGTPFPFWQVEYIRQQACSVPVSFKPEDISQLDNPAGVALGLLIDSIKSNPKSAGEGTGTRASAASLPPSGKEKDKWGDVIRYQETGGLTRTLKKQQMEYEEAFIYVDLLSKKTGKSLSTSIELPTWFFFPSVKAFDKKGFYLGAIKTEKVTVILKWTLWVESYHKDERYFFKINTLSEYGNPVYGSASFNLTFCNYENNRFLSKTDDPIKLPYTLMEKSNRFYSDFKKKVDCNDYLRYEWAAVEMIKFDFE